MSADAKALRLFGVARDSIEASAAGQPEPEPEPQPERPPCARRILDLIGRCCDCTSIILYIIILSGIGLIVFALSHV